MADDDLRPPSLAYEYEEAPMSELPAGVGSMPGKKKEAEEETELIAGRGCVPG